VARRVQCLKYLVLAYMLMESNVDPFDAQEAKPYKQVCMYELGVQGLPDSLCGHVESWATRH